MAPGLLGLKVGMTQVYDEQGNLNPVTVLQVGPCPVLQVRNQERDGYDAIQLGFMDKKREKTSRGERGHVASQMESYRRRYLTAVGRAQRRFERQLAAAHAGHRGRRPPVLHLLVR